MVGSVVVEVISVVRVEGSVGVKVVGVVAVVGVVVSVVVEVVTFVVGMEVDIGRVDSGVVVISANTVGMVLVMVLVFNVFVDGTLFFVVGIVLILWVIVYGGVAGVWVITGTVVGVWDELIAKSLAVVGESVVVPFPFIIFESPVCNKNRHIIK